MKVALVQPPHDFADLSPPLSLAYLAAFAKKENPGAVFRIFDLSRKQTPVSALGKFEPDIIGVTGSSPIAGSQATLLQSLRREFPRSRIYVGGPHASAVGEALLTYDIDGLVIGEGERTFSDILKQGGDATGIPGVMSRSGAYEEREKIKHIDAIPFPDRSLLRLPHYKIPGAIVTSRGCPYECLFCSQHVFGRNWRAHSPEYVVAEIDLLVNRYGLSVIRIMEDNPVLNKDRILGICDLLHRRGLAKKIRVENNSGIRADLVDADILTALKRVGMDVVWIGLESADTGVLKQMRKNITLDQVAAAVRLCKKLGLMVSLYITIGMPGDTLKKNRETLRYVKGLNVDNCLISMATPYPGSALLDWVERNGRWIERDYTKWFGHIDVDVMPPFDTADFPTAERMEAFRMWKAYVARRYLLIFFRRPGRAARYAITHRNVVADAMKNILRFQS